MIRVLPENLINQIAAGEVVERPASALKELIENSLDAGATSIAITFEEGGKKRMVVEDDGSGIEKSELSTALHRHATSKLPTDDLMSINFYGFRGEALASIASVAKVRITSNNGGGAFEIEADYGKISPLRPASLNRGTRIEIEDIFARTPARLKFLKSDNTEASYINDIISKMAAANPLVSFFVNGKKKYGVTPGLDFSESLKERLADVIGPDFIHNSLYLEALSEGVRIRGYVGVPSFNRPNNSDTLFFVNGRFVRDKLIISAVKNAYSDVLFSGRHPVIGLFIDVPAKDIDVNVHPQKLEVRFRESGRIFAFIASTIKARLASADVSSVKGSSEEKNFMAKVASLEMSVSEPSFPSHDFVAPMSASLPVDFAEMTGAVEASEDVDKPLGIAVAQIAKTFIVAKNVNGLVLVDQHAAHERVVYEKIKSALEKEETIPTQMLLIPEVVNIASPSIILNAADELMRIGFVIEAFGENAVLVRETPAVFGDFDVVDFVSELAAYLKEEGKAKNFDERIKYICTTRACHSSIRAGKELSLAEMNALLREMEKTPNFSACGHGRPTYVEFNGKTLAKLFKRT